MIPRRNLHKHVKWMRLKMMMNGISHHFKLKDICKDKIKDLGEIEEEGAEVVGKDTMKAEEIGKE